MSDYSSHAPLIDRLRGQAFLPGVHYVTQAEAWMREAAAEIERLRDIVCEYELREAENTLTPEEVEAILDRYTRQPFITRSPDTDR